MDTVERGAIRDEEHAKDAQSRDGRAGDVEKGGVDGVAGDGEDMMGEYPLLFPFLRLRRAGVVGLVAHCGDEPNTPPATHMAHAKMLSDSRYRNSPRRQD